MDSDPLKQLWLEGYSVAELWGHSRPVTRGTSVISEPHGLIWGILGIVEYQVSKGAGHRYFQKRIEAGDWIGIGFVESDKSSNPPLTKVPPIENAKFGRKKSSVGDEVTIYTDVRFVHERLFAEVTTGR